jgi:hypothetical protein
MFRVRHRCRAARARQRHRKQMGNRRAPLNPVLSRESIDAVVLDPLLTVQVGCLMRA